MPGGYLLNDVNADLMTLWRWLRNDAEGLIAEARPYFVPTLNDPRSYAALRDRYNHATVDTERALCFLALNHCCFNGLYRLNSRGEFNVPYGHRRSFVLPEHLLRLAAQRLQNATLSNVDFEGVVALAGVGDVVYADPPYLPAAGARGSVVNYTAGGFGIDEHRRLVRCARDAVARGAVVAISNHDTAEARSLYEDFSIKTLPVRRSIAAQATARRVTQELLAILGPLRE